MQIPSMLPCCTALAASIVLLAGPATAQLHDHLKCYRIKDPASHSAIVDLRPADQASFEVDAGCKLKVRSRELCVPVRKQVVESDAPDLDVSGAELTGAFLCYKVRCPQAVLPASYEVSDQFGTRAVTGLRTSTLCVPAIQGAPPVTTTTTTTLPDGIPRSCENATPPHCDGTCNNYNLACREEAGACACVFTDVFGGCPMADGGPPNCWGTCEGSHSCIEVAGACQCGFAFE